MKHAPKALLDITAAFRFDVPLFKQHLVFSVSQEVFALANHKSALKRIRQTVGRRARNVHFKTFMRNRVRRVREAVAAGDTSRAQDLLRVAISAIDHVASKGVIHSNTASRKVSRLSKLVFSLVSSKTAAAS